MTRDVPLLIVGAGPFGLSMGAYAQARDIEYLIVGRHMEFWRRHMPRGMILRSGCDWHLDPDERDTIVAYLDTLELDPSEVEPLALDRYLDYVRWFQERRHLKVRPDLVARLDRTDAGFIATMKRGDSISARAVVLALGFGYFKHVPADLAAMVPARRHSHTCDDVELDAYRGRRCLIIGGRQSAFEWAALLREAGADAVHVVHRHDTPRFASSNWSWFNDQVAHMANDPGWFRNLGDEERDAVDLRFWEEGRRKLEPWLAPRIDHDTVKLWPNTEMVGCVELRDGGLEVALSSGDRLPVDHVIFATGYKVDMTRLSLLAEGNILEALQLRGGFPSLDERMQSSLPGLFITSMPAVRDFGLFFAFTVSVRTSAHLIGPAVEARLAEVGGYTTSGRR